jgi:peroxiredoxin
LSSCEACKKEIEIIEKINKSGDLKIIGIMTEEKSKIEDFVKDHKVTFPIFVDKDAALFKSMKLKYFPTNLLVENGSIKKALLGLPEKTENFVEFITED